MTVDEQVTYLSDHYAKGLEVVWSNHLSAQAIKDSRSQFEAGLRGTITQPLTGLQLLDIDRWLTRDGSFPIESDPVDPMLAVLVRNDLAAIKGYLSRPSSTLKARWAIAGQVGVILDAVRQELVKQWSGVVPDAEARAADITFSGSLWLSDRIASPVVPEMKRLFSPSEMDGLLAEARKAVADSRAQWEDTRTGMSADASAKYTASPVTWEMHMRNGTAGAVSAILRASYSPPPELGFSKEEMKAMDAALVARGPVPPVTTEDLSLVYEGGAQ